MSSQTAKPDTCAQSIIPKYKHTPCDLPSTAGMYYTVHTHTYITGARTTGCERHVFCHLPECTRIEKATHCSRFIYFFNLYVYYYFHKRALHVYIHLVYTRRVRTSSFDVKKNNKNTGVWRCFFFCVHTLSDEPRTPRTRCCFFFFLQSLILYTRGNASDPPLTTHTHTCITLFFYLFHKRDLCVTRSHNRKKTSVRCSTTFGGKTLSLGKRLRR